MNDPRPAMISARPPEMRSSVEKSWKTRTGSSELRIVTALRALFFEVAPQVVAAGLVVAKRNVVGQRVTEKVAAFQPTPDRFGFIVVHHHRRNTGDLRIDALADRAAVLQLLLVGLDPAYGLFGIDERECQRAEALISRIDDGLAP